MKHWMRGDSGELRRITWQALMRRLFTRRRKRIEEWMRATEERAQKAQRPMWEPRISVCMAAYNGGRFVEAQLRRFFRNSGRTMRS